MKILENIENYLSFINNHKGLFIMEYQKVNLKTNIDEYYIEVDEIIKDLKKYNK